MTVATSLIPELDEIVKQGDPKRRAETARRIGELFLADAPRLAPAHVDLFDEVLIDLVPHAEVSARIDLSERLSQLSNAPRGLVGRLAHEDEILVAAPILRRSPVIDEPTLIDIARVKGQGHLLAMTERPTLSPDLTDVIVRRGEPAVVRSAAGNSGAQFSETGYEQLIHRAAKDGVLTLRVGQRDDLSEAQLKELLAATIDPVRRRLFNAVKPARQDLIKHAMAEISGAPPAIESRRRDFVSAQRTVLALHRDGYLNEGALFGFAKANKYEEAIAALSAMAGVSILTVDRLISGDRYDPILIMGKTVGLEWATIRALIMMRLAPHQPPSAADIETARTNFARLMPSTAERVVSFWKTRASF
jgi:uncharacterized protein (DUF2336 family)